MSEIKAIETVYAGYRFRSRLEARWAVFFDSMGWKWEYEPEGFDLPSGWYLPDFKVFYPDGFCHWFECKGDLKGIRETDWKRMLEFDEEEVLTVLDGVPALRMYCRPRDLLAITPPGMRHPSQEFIPESWAFDHKRMGSTLWSSKGRPWWDWHDNYFEDYHNSWDRPAVEEMWRAVIAARSARFEHGETHIHRSRK